MSIILGMEQKRKPLPPGAVISYMGETATVVEDRGAYVSVKIDDQEDVWCWKFEGVECVVVSDPSAPEDPPCTPEQIEAIRRAALARAEHFLKLADAIEEARMELMCWSAGDFPLLEESAAQLRQLGGKE